MDITITNKLLSDLKNIDSFIIYDDMNRFFMRDMDSEMGLLLRVMIGELTEHDDFREKYNINDEHIKLITHLSFSSDGTNMFLHNNFYYVDNHNELFQYMNYVIFGFSEKKATDDTLIKLHNETIEILFHVVKELIPFYNEYYFKKYYGWKPTNEAIQVYKRKKIINNLINKDE